MGSDQGGPRGFHMEDAEPQGEAKTPEGELPEMNFAALVLSLSASAMAHLGVAPEPGAEAPPKNLPLAKQTIDILALLEEKTKGNLDSAEKPLLESVIHDLRLQYVAARSD